MLSAILFIVLLIVAIIALFSSLEEENHLPWIIVIFVFVFLFFILSLATGLPIQNNEGNYTGYVTAVEKNGAIFKGMNVFIKTELESSNEDIACVAIENQELIAELRKAQEEKRNVTFEYYGLVQFPIGECPNSNWSITSIK
jgi:hypothetical protein